ncbi:MAG: hypothetical protein ACRDLT_11575 [Solirubrobacteraceae bacterium]
MKTMTCRQLGGPCDHAHRGKTANDMIKAQDKHLREMVAGGDGAHESALADMKGRWKNPLAGMGWYRQAKKDFAALAND